MIVATIAEKDAGKIAEKAALAKKEGADAVEIRLDFVESWEGIDGTLRRIELPIIATCRPEREGGNFRGPEYDRIELLKKAATLAEFIDVEYDTTEKMRQEIRKSAAEKGTVLIISKHYSEMPADAELERTYANGKKWGDLVKIVPKTKNTEENKRLMKFLTGKKDAIVFASGEKGKPTRIAAEALGSVFTYCCMGPPVAEGQMQVKEVKAARKKPPRLEKIRA